MPKPRRTPFIALVDHLARHRPDLPDSASAIVAGRVLVDGRVVDNPAARVRADAAVRVRPPPPRRGAHKLRAALDAFDVPVAGTVAVDVGAGTGGFTEVLLEAGTRLVYAVDAGHGQLAGSLRQDPRVRNLERTNLAEVGHGLVPEQADLVTLDLSYLAVARAAPQLEELSLAPGARLVAVVKPMFELGLGSPPGGDRELEEAVTRAVGGLERSGWRVTGARRSPVTGARGAAEYLLCARRSPLRERSRLRVALLQVPSCGTDRQANLCRGEVACRLAARLGADVALFPELWSIGAEPCPADASARPRWRALAVARDDAFVRHFAALAAELRMGIAVTYLERWEPAPRNVMTLLDRNGRDVLTYAKVHTCDFDWEAELTPGEAFEVAELDTAAGPVRVGAMICFDREFPESARVLMLRGAELILTPNACDLEEARLGQLRTRAFENMVGVAMANYPAPSNNGRSVAFSPVVVDEEGHEVDPLVVGSGPGEGVFIADFDLDELRAYRRRETWGNAYRRPALYGPLVSPDVDDPFVRPDARRDAP